MRAFIILTLNGKVVHVEAEEMLVGSASIQFYRNDKCIAEFYIDRISGWYETEIPDGVDIVLEEVCEKR